MCSSDLLRFNPDAAYLPRDNELPANTPYSYDTMLRARVAENIGDARLRVAAAEELADRTRCRRWDDDLDTILDPCDP